MTQTKTLQKGIYMMVLKFLAPFFLIIALDSVYCSSPNKNFNPRSIYHAFEENNLEKVQLFLDAGLDPNQTIEKFGYVIFLAKTPEMIDLLINHGARLNDIGKHKLSALSNAPGLEKAKYLVKLGARLTSDFEFEPPLHLLVRGSYYNCDLEMIQYYINLGADLTQKDVYGETPYGRFLHLKARATKHIKRYEEKEYSQLKDHERENLDEGRIFLKSCAPKLEKILKITEAVERPKEECSRPRT